MDQLDRLGWAAGFSFLGYGRRIGVRVSDASILSDIRERLPYGWRPSRRDVVERLYSVVVGGEDPESGLRRFNLLYGDSDRLERSVASDPILDSFETNLRMFVAEFARDRTFIHAGVVGWRGRAILIPGRSFSGKTTLVAALVRAGAGYYSDEFAVLDDRGLVHPFHKVMGLRPGVPGQANPVPDPPAKLGSAPLPVGLVVATEYREAGSWRPRRLSAGKAALELISNAVAARREKDAVMRVATQIATSAPVLKGSRGEADETAEAIIRRLEGYSSYLS
jgi:hypothetical protein